ncbi:MAG: hypothetical protein ACXW3Z_12485 [Limisphaerales bacterium]
MDEITVIVIVLTATWGGVFNVMKIVEMKNGLRNLVLDIDEKGLRLARDQKKILVWNDYFPIAIGVWIFLFVFAGGLFAIPSSFHLQKAPLNWADIAVCYGASFFCIFALLVDVVCSVREMTKMLSKIATQSTE